MSDFYAAFSKTESVPKSFLKLLAHSNLTINDMDLVVFHQANTFMLEQLRKYCKIPINQLIGNDLS